MENKKAIGEGKTTNDAVENALKELGVAKKDVDIKVLEEDKKSFFNILAPRVVRVELTVKENIVKKKEVSKSKVKPTKARPPIVERTVNKEDLSEGIKIAENFVKDIVNNLDVELKYSVEEADGAVFVNIEGEGANHLIGYRGETLKAFQTIINSVVNKNKRERIRVRLDIEGYNKKREKILENLAEKIAKNTIKTKKSFTLEPMSAYERKIIHNYLQKNDQIKTYSVGEEPYRKIVIAINED